MSTLTSILFYAYEKVYRVRMEDSTGAVIESTMSFTTREEAEKWLDARLKEIGQGPGEPVPARKQ